jgi:hypothetical protein
MTPREIATQARLCFSNADFQTSTERRQVGRLEKEADDWEAAQAAPARTLPPRACIGAVVLFEPHGSSKETRHA